MIEMHQAAMRLFEKNCGLKRGAFHSWVPLKCDVSWQPCGEPLFPDKLSVVFSGYENSFKQNYQMCACVGSTLKMPRFAFSDCLANGGWRCWDVGGARDQLGASGVYMEPEL